VEAALSARVRSAIKSSHLSERRRSTSDSASGPTVGSRSLRQVASAVARASSSSFLRALPQESTCIRAESLGGTSSTDSSAATNLWARYRPSSPAFPTTQRRSPNRFAQRPQRLSGQYGLLREASTLDELAELATAVTAIDALRGSTPMSNFMRARTSVSVTLLPLWRA
jgi:hypothetical protein